MTKEKKLEYSLFIAWAASLTAMLGSLYFSEIMKYEPCTLCWYQRILMYPFVVILGIAVIRKDYWIARYSLPLALIGACISVYHYTVQKLPALSGAAAACGRIPCTGQYINWLGFITIPFLALTSFIVIIFCSIILIQTLKGGTKS